MRSMDILLHICCAPCAIYPLEVLRASGAEVTGFFFNHNIHPYQEFSRRLETLKEYSSLVDLPVVYREEYLLEVFLGAVASHPEERCRYCYSSRIEETARAAAELGCSAFTTTLLYSRYQAHDAIREEGERAGKRHGVMFHYEDYRTGWRRGIEISKEIGLYRQQYCGCIYSEKDRYAPKNKASRVKSP